MEGQQLPKATMGSFVKKHSDLHCSPDFIIRLLELSKEFIVRLADKSNQICESNSKKTISAEHLEAALEDFGLTSHLDHLKQLQSDIKEMNDLKREASKRLEENIERERQEERDRRMKEEPEKKEVVVREKFEQLDVPEGQQDDYQQLGDAEKVGGEGEAEPYLPIDVVNNDPFRRIVIGLSISQRDCLYWEHQLTKRCIMIDTRTSHVRLPKTFLKILYICPAANDTFAFLAVVDIGRDALYHCDRSGTILYEYRFEHPVDSFVMPTTTEVVVLYSRGNKIYLFDLPKRRFLTCNHEFMYEEADQSEVLAFSATNYLCVREKGNHGDHRLHLTYYMHPLSAHSTPFAYFHSKDNQWTSEMEVFKGNTHSLVVWCKRRQDEQIDVRCFDLRGKKTGQFHQYRFRSTLGTSYNLPRVDIAINNIFEIRPHNICLVCFSTKNESRAVNKDGVVNNNFILHTEQPNCPYITESSFYFEGIWNDRLTCCITIGAFAVFRTFDFRGTEALLSPVFYLNSQGQLVCSETWRCTYRTKLFVPGYSDSMLIEAELQNGEVSEFTLHQKRVLDTKAQIKQRLRQIYEEFEEQLVSDVCDLLDTR